MDHARGNTILESLGRSGRRAFGAAGAAALLAGWAWLTDPPEAGFAGIVFALVSGVFVALLAFRREESSETIPWGQLLWPLLAADCSRRLQSLLPPGDRIVALELRSLSTPGQTRKEDQQESAPAARRGPGGFTPGEFCPRDPAVGYRIALVRTEGPLTDHLAVDLFEEVPVGAGPIFVTEVAGAGDVTAILGPWEGPLEGPVRVSPGTRDTVAGRELLNLGWFDRSRVSCHGR